jgi:hypothetical protein
MKILIFHITENCKYNFLLVQARQGSSYLLMVSERAFGIPARGMIRGWRHEYWQSIHGQRQAKTLC